MFPKLLFFLFVVCGLKLELLTANLIGNWDD